MVGGCVRDRLLGVESKDIDIEVFGIPAERLERIVGERHPYSLCGVSFGVLKLKNVDIDVSLPRRESKSGIGHRGFSVLSDPSLSVAEASLRRDFTINAIYLDPLTGEVIDPNGGIADLKAKVLRHVSPKFVEDPLRVLRGMQFVARFDLEPAPETIQICRGIGLEGLAAERMEEEWTKLLLKGVRISKGLEFLRSTGWISFYPQLEALVGCRQDPKWHPEGDVWEHTKCCLDAFAERRTGDSHEDLVVGLAVLCHDLGKPKCSFFDRSVGRIRSLGHDEQGVAPARAFLEGILGERALIDEVLPLVECHMRPYALWKSKAREGAIRRLSAKVKRIDRLVRVCTADDAGRPPFKAETEPLEWLLAEAKRLEVADSAPKPLLMGRDLLAAGMRPGPEFGRILAKAYEAQLDGVFTDREGAIDWFRHDGGYRKAT